MSKREKLRAEIAMAICMVGCGIAAHRSDYFGEADAALAALEAAGVRLVPSEATQEMTGAVLEPTASRYEVMKTYSDMIAASPYAPTQKEQTHESD